jgi:BASS family bile acid:Na+ symporter
LTVSQFREVRRRPLVVGIGLLSPLLLMPPVALVLVFVFRPTPEIAAGLLLITACPIGGISNTYSYLARAAAALSVTLTGLSCLLAVVTIPLMTRVFEAARGESLGFKVPAEALVAQLLVVLAGPIALGMAIRHRYPRWADERQPAVQRVAFAALALLIVLVIVDQRALFRAQAPATIELAAVFVVLSFGIGWTIGGAIRAEPRVRFTLAAEFATRNVAIAAAIAVTALGRLELAVFATIYFLTELPLMLAAVVWFRRRRPAA